MTAASAVTTLAPRRQRLDNGAVVIVQPTATTPAVSLNVSLDAGSLCDAPDAIGTAYFLSRVIDRGTAAHAADDIAEILDVCGVSLSISVTRHTFSLSGTCLAEDFDRLLAVVASMVQAPTVPAAEVETRRSEVLTTLRQAEDNPANRSMERVMAMLYGDTHPYGRPGKGTPAAVARIERATLRNFHRRWMVPAALTVVVVGDVGAGEAVDAVTKAVGGWTAAGDALPALVGLEMAAGRRRDTLPMPGKSQADISYGFTTIRRRDPRYQAYSLMATIFGQYGLGGRLGRRIREQQGMAYYAFCSFEASQIEGPLVVRAGVNGANVERAIASIDQEVGRLARDGVTADEVDDAKRYLVGSLPRTLETNAGIAAFLQHLERFELGLDYAQRLPGLIEAVAREEINAAAAEVLDVERAMVAVAGPVAEASPPAGG